MADDEVYRYLEQEFEWNRLKAARNAIKHGVRFTEAATVLFDPEAITRVDEEHSTKEQRYTVAGYSLRSRVLFVVHVVRAERVRIISPRKATMKERVDYEAELGR